MNEWPASSVKRNFTLERELWMWRGIAVFLLLMLLVINFITFTIDRTQHARDNAERAATWQELRGGAAANRNMILRNYDAIIENSREIRALEAEVRRCSSCHGHKRGTPLMRERPIN